MNLGATVTAAIGGRPHRKIVPRQPTYGCLGDEVAQLYAGRELERELEIARGVANPDTQAGEEIIPQPAPLTTMSPSATVGSWMGTVAAGLHEMSASNGSSEIVLDDSMLDMLVDAMGNGESGAAGSGGDAFSQANAFGTYTSGTHWLEQLIP